MTIEIIDASDPQLIEDSQLLAIAHVCHEANRALCLTQGDGSQKAWDDAPEWQKASALTGVRKIAAGDLARFRLKTNRLALRKQLIGNKGLKSLALQNGGRILFALHVSHVGLSVATATGKTRTPGRTHAWFLSPSCRCTSS